LLDHASVSRGAVSLVRLDNYPASWAEELVVRGFAMEDPVHLASLRTNAGFRWSELGRMIRLGPRHRTILTRSRYHGLADGFTVPANVVGEPSASCSFAVRTGCVIPSLRLSCAELVGAHALRAARRLRPKAASAIRPRLSPRELQCLKLVALGKTDWEIGRILGLSVHTARQYVKSARAAYRTVSRTQLIAYGLRDGWISIEDAIPPSG
jgi:LuxR family quorum-sensing system transcriptional regulator CciR